MTRYRRTRLAAFALLLVIAPAGMAGSPAARQGDPTAHGGVIVIGCPTVLIGGMPAARVGDMHTCPMVMPPGIPHVGGPIQPPGSPTVRIGGMPAARMGDSALCVGVGQLDPIVMGCPTVLIGP